MYKDQSGFQNQMHIHRVTVYKANRERMDITHKLAEARTTDSTILKDRCLRLGPRNGSNGRGKP